MLEKGFWEKKHQESYGRYNRVTDFSRFCYYNFMKTKKGKVLELCCGKGADSIFFHNKGMKVTAIDYSTQAIKQFTENQKKYDLFISSMVKNILEPLPYENDSFDYVYCRLGLHYFTTDELKKIFKEIHRILRDNGRFMFQVKSTSDKEYGKGEEIEEDMYAAKDGNKRHFYSKEFAESIISDFKIIMIEERKIPNGSSYLEIIVEK